MKTFLNTIRMLKQTTYTEAEYAVYLAATLNPTFKFTPINKPNGVIGTLGASAEYTLQRRKRIKGNTVLTPNASTTSNDLAALDQFSKVDWVSIEVATGALRSVGVKLSINEEFDATTDGDLYKATISDAWEVEAIERNEKLIGEIFDNATKKVAVVAPTATTTPTFDGISKAINDIILLEDDFKGIRSKKNLVIWANPLIEPWIIKEIGTVFRQEAPIYKTGLMSKTSIDGVPVVFSGNLNKFQDTDKTKRLAFIVMDMEALAVKVDGIKKLVNINLGLTKYVGKFFYTIEKLVDADRVVIGTMDATGIFDDPTKKVSA